MDRACENAAKIADFLLSHPRVAGALSRTQHTSGHDIAKKQMKKFGAMLSLICTMIV
ncbi:MAG: PLP-dependent transferase [Saprospiraceae bacterium]